MQVSLTLEFYQTNAQRSFAVKIKLEEYGSSTIEQSPKSMQLGTLTIFEKYQKWINAYQRMQRLECRSANSSVKNAVTSYREASESLKQEFQTWLLPIEQTLKEIEEQVKRDFCPADLLLIFIHTTHLEIKQLPWHEWELSFANFNSTEVILSHLSLPQLELQSRSGKILVIVDDCDVGDWRGAGITKTPNVHVQSKSYASLQAYQWNTVCWMAQEQLACEHVANLNIDHIILMQHRLPSAIAQDFLSKFVESYIHRDLDFYAAVKEARDCLEGFALDFPGVQWSPTICHHPQHRVLSWQEYCQGKRDRRRVVLPPEEIERRSAVIEQLRQGYSSNLLIQSWKTPANIGIQVDSIDQNFDLPKLKHYFENISIQFEVGKTLLILGEAGSGKSTALLELTHQILKQTRPEYDQPIPFVLNLAAWAQNKLSLEDWIVGELERKYKIRATLSRMWLRQEQLTLMLDGLDEVAKFAREDCIRQLKEFVRQYQRTDIVVCCRASVYETLTSELEFKAVVRLMPLSDQQIDQILQQQGETASALTEALNRDREFKQLAQSPLVLDMLLSVFQHPDAVNISALKTDQERYRYVFSVYTDQTLERPMLLERARLRYRKRLSWLAARLSEESLTEFWIEQLEPKWLKSTAQRFLYKLIFSTNFALIFGILLAVIIWLGIGIVATEVLGLIVALIVSSFCALMFGLWVWLTYAKEQVIRPVETLNWSRSVVIKVILLGGAMGIGIAVISKLVGFIFAGPLIVLTSEVKGSRLRDRTFANEGIWRSLNHALTFAAISSATLGIAAIAFMQNMIGLFGDEAWLNTHPADWIFWFKLRLVAASCVTGLFFGLTSAGIACVQHFSLRIVLMLKGYLPFDYASFLNDACERALLRKVEGSGYIFVHPLLKAYFSQFDR